MKYAYLSILLTIYLICSTLANRHMICKDVENVFDESGGGTRHQARLGLPGPPGKRGSVGPPGAKGDRGEPGEIDYSSLRETIQEMVNAQVQEKLSDIYNKLDELNSTLANQNKQATKNCSVLDSFSYKNKCYWLALKIKNDAVFSGAQSLCSEDGGEPGDVLDQRHYDMITELFWSHNSATRWFWTGMNVNSSTKDATKSDGSRSNFQKWYSSTYPESGTQNTGILIQIGGAKTDTNGMYNRPPSNKAYGALCQS